MNIPHLWQVLEDDERDDVLHLVPPTDWRPHVATAACPCHPMPHPHLYGSMLVHNAVTEPQQIH